MRLSIKLGALCAVAAVLPLIVVSVLVLPAISSRERGRSAEKLQADARIASALYDKRLIELLAAAGRVADEIANRALVNAESADRTSATEGARLQDLFPRAQADYFLDFIIVTDPLGRVIARHNDRPSAGETLLNPDDKNAIVEKVITGGTIPAASCVVERGERYARLGLDRIAQVRLADGSTIDEALMIEAGAPIFSEGRFLGVALIGQMLNTYFKPRARPSSGGLGSLQTPLVAEIRQTLAHTMDEDSGALVAFGNAVIASSVPPSADGRNSEASLAGTLHDPSKTEETLREGGRSYSVAWQPIKTLDGLSIGAIGVAHPSSEREGASSAGTTMLVIGALALIAAAIGGFVVGRALGARLDDLANAAGRWSVGDLSATASDNEPMLARWIPADFLRDEINHLTEQLDGTRESFRQAIERLRKRS